MEIISYNEWLPMESSVTWQDTVVLMGLLGVRNWADVIQLPVPLLGRLPMTLCKWTDFLNCQGSSSVKFANDYLFLSITLRMQRTKAYENIWCCAAYTNY